MLFYNWLKCVNLEKFRKNFRKNFSEKIITVIPDGAMIITVVIHQDLFHFSVVQIVQISDRIFRSRDQIQQNGRGFDTSDELVL